MYERSVRLVAATVLTMLSVACGAPPEDTQSGEVAAGSEAQGGGTYRDLLALFEEFREFHEPVVTDGVPDYTAAAMERQYRELGEYQRRLAAFDISGWEIPEQVDYHLVRAEMNGLEFYHRVTKPWTTNPDFYWGSPSSTGSPFYGFSGSRYGFSGRPEMPLGEEQLEVYRTRLQALPQILAQGKANINLAEAKRDLALLGLRSMNEEGVLLGDLVEQMREHHPDLVEDTQRAWEAVQDYRDWIEANLDSMTAPSGVGVEDFNWWLKNVWLLPYTWDEAWAMSRREYDRNLAELKLEEFRNRDLPPLELPTTAAEYITRYNRAADDLLRFLRGGGFVSLADEFEAVGARPPSGDWIGQPMAFFGQVASRNPMQLIIHEDAGHVLDLRRSQDHRSPIRATRRLYEMTHPRREGLAGGLEEMLMHAGLYDENPRGREMQLIAFAHEGARSMGELMFIANELDYLGSEELEAELTPYGWAVADSGTMWNHKRDGVRAPGYEVAYPVGRAQLDKIVADRAHQLGDRFNLPDIIDEVIAAGVIPFALVHWELTGLTDEVAKLW